MTGLTYLVHRVVATGGATAHSRAAPQGAVLVGFGAVVVLLGVNFVAVSLSNRELAPFWGAGLRFAVASAALFAIMAVRRIPFPKGSALRSSVGMGALGFGGAYALIYWGLLSVPAGVASVVFATVPLSTFLLTVALRMESFRTRGLAGAIIVIAGVAAVSFEQFAGRVDPARFVAVILSSLAATGAGILVKRAPRTHPASMNAVGMGVGAAVLLAVSAAAGEHPALPGHADTWAALGYLIASSVTAFMLWVWIIARWTISAVSYQAVLSPLVTLGVAAAVLGEPVTTTLAAGTALVLSGVYVGTLRNRREAAAPASPG